MPVLSFKLFFHDEYKKQNFVINVNRQNEYIRISKCSVPPVLLKSICKANKVCFLIQFLNFTEHLSFSVSVEYLEIHKAEAQPSRIFR
jgi:hypothetical protein